MRKLFVLLLVSLYITSCIQDKLNDRVVQDDSDILSDKIIRITEFSGEDSLTVASLLQSDKTLLILMHLIYKEDKLVINLPSAIAEELDIDSALYEKYLGEINLLND